MSHERTAEGGAEGRKMKMWWLLDDSTSSNTRGMMVTVEVRALRTPPWWHGLELGDAGEESSCEKHTMRLKMFEELVHADERTKVARARRRGLVMGSMHHASV